MSGRPAVTPGPAVEQVPLWYHTLELPDGSVTPGWFDLRPIAARLPWPDVRGKRCLDVGTYDGFYAFELERRGAREVVATDIGDHREWDIRRGDREIVQARFGELAGEKGQGFDVARSAFGSSVRKRIISVYDLSPDEVGTFDVVVCGSLLLHLRDPLRALEAIHSVCSSWFISIEEISLPLTARFRRRPVADMRFYWVPTQWWVPNLAGHRHMIDRADFDVVEGVGPFAVPFGAGYPRSGRGPRSPLRRAARRVLAGGAGVPHAAVLARPS